MRGTIHDLRALGYHLDFDGQALSWSWHGEGQPNAEEVTPLLAHLRHNKDKAIEYLEKEQAEPNTSLMSDLPPEAPAPVRDPFTPPHYSLEGMIVVLPDRDRPGQYRAHRSGSLDLERQEEACEA